MRQTLDTASVRVVASSNFYKSGRARLDSVTVVAELDEYNESIKADGATCRSEMLYIFRVRLHTPTAEIQKLYTILISKNVYIC